MALSRPWVNQLKQKFETIHIPVTVLTHATVASQRAYATGTDGAYFFTKTDGQTITTFDAAPGFTTADLTDASAPSIYGCILQVGDALAGASNVLVEVPPSTIVAGSTGLTALGTVTPKGASSNYVTASGNISFIFGLTGVDGDASTSTATFVMRVTYLKAQPV